MEIENKLLRDELDALREEVINNLDIMQGQRNSIINLSTKVKNLKEQNEYFAELNDSMISGLNNNLKAANMRNTELLEILRSLRLNANPSLFSLGQLALVDAALKPNESGAD